MSGFQFAETSATFAAMTRPLLHDYFRSSAAYRVRIALNLKGVEYDRQAVNLVEGEQVVGEVHVPVDVDPFGLHAARVLGEQAGMDKCVRHGVGG